MNKHNRHSSSGQHTTKRSLPWRHKQETVSIWRTVICLRMMAVHGASKLLQQAWLQTMATCIRHMPHYLILMIPRMLLRLYRQLLCLSHKSRSSSSRSRNHNQGHTTQQYQHRLGPLLPGTSFTQTKGSHSTTNRTTSSGIRGAGLSSTPTEIADQVLVAAEAAPLSVIVKSV